MSPTVLLVDNDETLRVVLPAVLADHVTMRTATTLEDVRCRLDEDGAADVFIVNPEVVSLAQFIAELEAHVGHVDRPVIALSFNRDEKSRRRALDTGATSYITRPFDVIDLCEQLQPMKSLLV